MKAHPRVGVQLEVDKHRLEQARDVTAAGLTARSVGPRGQGVNHVMDRIKESVAGGMNGPLRVPWTLIALASAAPAVVVALVAVAGVRATTSASGATALIEDVARGAMVAIPVALAQT